MIVLQFLRVAFRNDRFCDGQRTRPSSLANLTHPARYNPGMLFRATVWRWAVVLVPALAIYFAPLPGFTAQQMHLLAIFAGTIIALVAQPVPMGVSESLR
ncbi:MAG: anion permease [Acidobacteriota bacterium]|nr:anion permease [Acidobacteriota bacterium]